MTRSRSNIRTFTSSSFYKDNVDYGRFTLSPVRNSGSESTALLTKLEVTDSNPTSRSDLDADTGLPTHRDLCSYYSLPQWQKDNDYITHGYVRETKDIFHCLDTLFFFNNESINIFSHLLPGTLFPLMLFLFVPYAVSHTNFINYIPPFLIHLPAYTTNDKYDNYIFGIFVMGFVTCLSCSATFHMLKVHSKKVASMGSRLDYAGIILLIGSSLIGIIHYSLVDYPIAKTLFISITTIIGLCALICTWHPDFRSPEWRTIRTITFVSFSLSGLIPILFGFLIFETQEAIDRAGLKYVLFEAISYLSGASIYAFRLPERWIPGKVNMIGNSHQIFHVLVVFGGWFHFNALAASYKFAKSVTLGGSPI